MAPPRPSTAKPLAQSGARSGGKSGAKQAKAPPKAAARKTVKKAAPAKPGRTGLVNWVRRHPVPMALAAALLVFGAVTAGRSLLPDKPAPKPKPPVAAVAEAPKPAPPSAPRPAVMAEEPPPRPIRIPRLPEVPPPPPVYATRPVEAEPPAPASAPVIEAPPAAAEVRPAPAPAAPPSALPPPAAPPVAIPPVAAPPPAVPPPAIEPAPPVEVAVLPPPERPTEDRAGQPLWLKNAVPAVLPADRPAIAIIIDDMGLDRKRSARVVTLPAPLTLAWLAYAGELSRQTKAARAAGHELLVHVPMEPEGGDEDPGPGALLTSLSRDEVIRRFRAGLDSFDGYVGVNNHMGSKFTANHALMQPVLAELKNRGLMWVDSKTTAASAGPTIAHNLKMPNVSRDVFLDNEMTPAAVRAQLAKVEQVARRAGMAVAIGHPHDVTVDALAQWLPTLARRGFTLVPVSAIVRARFAGG